MEQPILRENHTNIAILVFERDVANTKLSFFRLVQDSGDLFYACRDSVPIPGGVYSSLSDADYQETVAVRITRKSLPRYSRLTLFALLWSLAMVAIAMWLYSKTIIIVAVPILILISIIKSSRRPVANRMRNMRCVGEFQLPVFCGTVPQISKTDYELAEINAIRNCLKSDVDIEIISTLVRSVVERIKWFINRHIIEDDLIFDLGLDSLDLVELVIVIEESLGVSVPDDIKLGTLGDLLRAVLDNYTEAK